MRRFKPFVWWAVPLLIAMAAGCASKPQQSLIAQVQGTEMTEHELRARVNELTLEISGNLETEARIIYYESSDPAVRRTALITAVRVNEIIVRTAQHDDALIALLDIWAFTGQMSDFFASSAGGNLFGEYQQIAIEVAESSEAMARAVAEEIGGDFLVEDASARFEEWIQEHPMGRGLYRPSIAPWAATMTTPKGQTLFSVSETVEESLSRLTNRIDVLNFQLPKQIVWRAALLIEHQIEAARELAAGLRPLIDEERTVIMQEVERQRVDTLDAIDRQRIATLKVIDIERESVFADIDRVVDDTFGRIEQQRTATLDDVQVLLAGMVKDAEVEATDVVDYVFWRSLLLIAAGFVCGLVLVVVLRASRRPA